MYTTVLGKENNNTHTHTHTRALCTELIQCPHLNIANGQVTVIAPNRLVGSRAIYQCNSGYVLVGDDNRICLENSTWSGDNPKCSKCFYACTGYSGCMPRSSQLSTLYYMRNKHRIKLMDKKVYKPGQ